MKKITNRVTKKKNKKYDKKFLIGRYQLGWRMVNLFADPNYIGASFNLCLNKQDSFINCGMDNSNIGQCYAWLCHEVFEMAAGDQNCIFKPVAFEAGASDVVNIFMNHNQYTEIISKASYFLTQCNKDFEKAHKNIHNEKKRT